MDLLTRHGIVSKSPEVCSCPTEHSTTRTALCPECYGLTEYPGKGALLVAYNDGGRVQAGYKGDCGDCVVRALAIAMDRPYKEVYAEIAAVNATTRKTKNRSATVGRKTARSGIYAKARPFIRYMESHGWHWVSVRGFGDRDVPRFRRGNLPGGRIIVSLRKHYCAVINGVIHDTHDPSRKGTVVINGYWVRNSTTPLPSNHRCQHHQLPTQAVDTVRP